MKSRTRAVSMVFVAMLLVSAAVAGVQSSTVTGTDTGSGLFADVSTDETVSESTYGTQVENPTVSGRLVTADGQPISYGSLIQNYWNDTESGYSWEGINDNGKFAVAGERGSNKQLTYFSQRYENDGLADIYAFSRVELNGERDLGDVEIPEAHALQTRVVDDEGNPVEGARVSVFHNVSEMEHTSHIGWTTNDAGEDPRRSDGTEVVGDVRVRVELTRYATGVVDKTHWKNLTVTEDRSITITLDSRNYSSISGRFVTEDGEPVRTDRVANRYWNESVDEVSWGLPDPDGTFEVNARTGMRNRVTFFNTSGGYDGIADLYTVHESELTESEDLGDVVIPDGHMTEIDVVDESGNHADDVRVEVFHEATRLENTRRLYWTPSMNRERSGPITTLELAGNVSVRVIPEESATGLVQKTYRKDATVTEAGGITVTVETRPTTDGRLVNEHGDVVPRGAVSYASWPDADTDSTYSWNDVTDNGEFSIPGKPGTHNQLTYFEEYYENDGLADLYAFERGEFTGETDLGEITIPEGHATKVRVVDENGDPVEGAQVRMYHRLTTAERSSYLYFTSNESGYTSNTPDGFELTGDISILVKPEPGHAETWKNVTITDERTITVTVESRPTISGRLVTEDGEPIQTDHMVHTRRDGRENESSWVESGENGQFVVNTNEGWQNQFTFMVGGENNGVADIHGFGVPAIAENRNLGDVVVPDGHLLRVHVVDEAGNAVKNTSVRVFPDADINKSGYLWWPPNANRSEEGYAGEVEVAGDVHLQVIPEENATGVVDKTYWKNVTVTEDRNVTITLDSKDEKPTISGRLVTEDGEPIANDMVSLWYWNETAGDHSRSVQTDENGQFEMVGTPDTKNQLTFFQVEGEKIKPENDGLVDMYNLGKFELSEHPEDVDLGEVVVPEGHLLKVHVADDDGNSTDGVYVNKYHDVESTGHTSWMGAITEGGNSEQSPETAGVELTGDIKIAAFPSEDANEYVQQVYWENITLTEDRTVRFTVETVADESDSTDEEETGDDEQTDDSQTGDGQTGDTTDDGENTEDQTDESDTGDEDTGTDDSESSDGTTDDEQGTDTDSSESDTTSDADQTDSSTDEESNTDNSDDESSTDDAQTGDSTESDTGNDESETDDTTDDTESDDTQQPPTDDSDESDQSTDESSDEQETESPGDDTEQESGNPSGGADQASDDSDDALTGVSSNPPQSNDVEDAGDNGNSAGQGAVTGDSEGATETTTTPPPTTTPAEEQNTTATTETTETSTSQAESTETDTETATSTSISTADESSAETTSAATPDEALAQTTEAATAAGNESETTFPGFGPLSALLAALTTGLLLARRR